MGAEVQTEVSDSYRQVRMDLERKINERISSQDYGPGLVKWYFIAVIRAIDDPRYCEIQNYIKSKKEVEFRKRIDYGKFKAADSLGQRVLVIHALVESIHLMSKMGIDNFYYRRLLDDVIQLAQDERWLER